MRLGDHFIINLLLLLLAIFPTSAVPISLHPDNPRYFLYREKPTILITSGEHYGAVIHSDFDYVKYLDTLAGDHLNLTRVFSGSYFEPPGAFNIAGNTLAPPAEKCITPWFFDPHSGKYDLTRWNNAYFSRLNDFISQASRRNIIVEYTLFCTMYGEAQWQLSPFHAKNNRNGLGAIRWNDVLTLDKHGGLLAVQEAFVRKVISELRDAENVIYEICNEPYLGDVTLAWQHHIADVITQAEKDFPQKHLISQNIANGSAKIANPHPAVSVFQFHYAHPPRAVTENFALNKPIGDNETGFKGTADTHYRMEAWEFILAGGALYNNLDYSFSPEHEDGTFVYPSTQPGGGNAGFRKQMQVLHHFIHGFPFLTMKPARDRLKNLSPKNAQYQMLAQDGKCYAAYFKCTSPITCSLDLPAGTYDLSWIDVIHGNILRSQRIEHAGGIYALRSPAKTTECALRIVRDLQAR